MRSWLFCNELLFIDKAAFTATYRWGILPAFCLGACWPQLEKQRSRSNFFPGTCPWLRGCRHHDVSPVATFLEQDTAPRHCMDGPWSSATQNDACEEGRSFKKMFLKYCFQVLSRLFKGGVGFHIYFFINFSHTERSELQSVLCSSAQGWGKTELGEEVQELLQELCWAQCSVLLAVRLKKTNFPAQAK